MIAAATTAPRGARNEVSRKPIKVGGKAVCGFAAFKEHLSYFPPSGSVLPQLTKELARYSMTKGALRFAIDKPLPHTLVKKLIAVRLAELQRR
jgi:uncharacterized protein YdhG (YjbR/CyaY superfamily)